MARYSKIGHNVWGDEKFAELSKPKPNAQTLWLFLLSCPLRTSLPGVIAASLTTVAEALGWSFKATEKCWSEIVSLGMAKRDSRVIWLPKSVFYDPPHNPNVAKSWGSALSEIPETALRKEIVAYLKRFLEPFGESFVQSFRNGLGNRLLNDLANIPPPYPPPPTSSASASATVSETVPGTIPATAAARAPVSEKETGAPGPKPDKAEMRAMLERIDRENPGKSEADRRYLFAKWLDERQKPRRDSEL